jgi:murein DD-endopeptidase MepM/ murein hydrolase activator NlpD
LLHDSPATRPHGRRRAGPQTAAASPLGPSTDAILTSRRDALVISRRDALSAERTGARPRRGSSARRATARVAIGSGAGQMTGMAIAIAGLALAVTIPTTSAGASPSMPAPDVPPAAVSAAAGASVAFSRTEVRSGLSPDGKLHQALAVSASKVTAAASKGILSAPLDTLAPTSAFGSRISPLTGEKGEEHTGQDFAVACGTAVHAAAGGTVSFAGWHPYGGGNRVVIDHGNGLSSTYNHLSSSQVAVGQQVDRGAVVAHSGTTGASTGCHLHFEVLIDSVPVDPLGWL